MRKSDFARLCQVSAPMIAKYFRQGLVVMNGEAVDAAASLKALAGHLDENKRIAAIIALADGTKPAPRAESPPADAPAPAAPATASPSPEVINLAEFQASRNVERARLEKTQADLKEIELLQLTGRLVDAAAVAREIENSVTIFWSELQRRERDEADILSAKLGLDQLQARRLREALRQRNIGLREDYAKTMAKLASGTRKKPDDHAPAAHS